MSIQLTCPGGHMLTVADAWAGRSGRCPVCKAPVQVPALASTPAAPAATVVIRLSDGSKSAVAVPDKPPIWEALPASSAATGSATKTPPPLPVQSTKIAPPTPTTPDAAFATPQVAPAANSVLENVIRTEPVPSLTAFPGAPGPSATAGKRQAPPTERASPAAGKERTPQLPLPPQSAPPKLPVVASAPVVAAARPPTVALPPVNGTAQPISPAPNAPQNVDAVFENIAVNADAHRQSRHDVRRESALVPDFEAAALEFSGTKFPHASFDATGARAATGYRPDADKRRTVYYLAAAMVALSLYCMGPAVAHLNLGTAPNWARALLLLSLLQLAYAAWAASIPDWATLRSSMIIFTIVAALYGLTMTVALSTPTENTLPLDLTEVRRQAVLWCAGVVLLASLLAYGCGRAAWRWRRTLEMLQV